VKIGLREGQRMKVRMSRGDLFEKIRGLEKER
jgi:predicted DNA-binding antitoxin AbrB/MazE fold protein